VPEAVGLVALFHLEKLTHQREVHAHEPGAAQFLNVAALALPEVALPLLGDEVGEPGTETQGREVDLVKCDLAQVAPAAEHVGRQRIVLVARPAAHDDDPAERLQELGRLLALRELDQLSTIGSRFSGCETVSIVDL
jgi:hypothetical protein